MLLKGIVVDVILLVSPWVSAITNVTFLMLVPTMCIELVVTVEPLPTKAAFRVTFEAALIHGSRIVISKLLMLAELLLGEKLMLMSEHFLVPGAKITHDLLMNLFNMTVKIRPSPACNIARCLWTVIAQ